MCRKRTETNPHTAKQKAGKYPGLFHFCYPAVRAVPILTESSERLYPFVFTHCPTHRSRIRNQSSGLISLRRRFALLLEML
ncbi:hypothetical protein F9K79_01105 [Ochrobactrum sp. Kaboul]|nr:hypothetical protein F9K79_01105 [Ochrobactrum sp. Kaboul]